MLFTDPHSRPATRILGMHLSSSMSMKVAYNQIGMNAGNWHRLDNVFAILLAQSLFLYFANFEGSFYNDILRWVSLCVCLYFQELSPWNIVCTIVPILFSVIILGVKLYISKERPQGNLRNTLFAFGFGSIAGFFFYKGLNDAADYLRIYHGLWHFFAGISIYFFYLSRDAEELKKIL